MKQVTEQEFWNYFKDKEYITEQGNIFHSDNFIVDGEIVGYRETSSWSMDILYELKYGTINTETISFVGNIIKNKL